MTSLINMTSFQATVVYQRAGKDAAVAGLAVTWAGMSALSKYDVIDKYDVISGNKVYQRAGNDVAVAGLAGSWAGMSALSVCDVIGKYDVISDNSGVPAGGQ
jgi:hypothetical protein